MRLALTLFLSLAVFLGGVQVLSAAGDDPAQVAQAFYDRYIKVANARGDTRKEVAKSKSFTPALKKAYAAAMKEPSIDPILQAQDYPDAGFKASAANVKGDTATVTMKSRDAGFAHSIKVTLTKKSEGWQISAIGDLKEK